MRRPPPPFMVHLIEAASFSGYRSKVMPAPTRVVSLRVLRNMLQRQEPACGREPDQHRKCHDSSQAVRTNSICNVR